MVNLKITLKLKADAAPHLSITKLKELIIKDKTLSPAMRKLLLLIKKTRMPYIIMPFTKEIIFVPSEYLHLERGIEPQLTNLTRLDWNDEEKANYTKNPKLFVKNALELYQSLGYELFNEELIDDETIMKLLSTTKKIKTSDEKTKAHL